MSDSILSANGINVGDYVICNEKMARLDGAPRKGLAYKVAKFSRACGDYYLWPEGFNDGWRVHLFTKAGDFKKGDIVRCIDTYGTYPLLNYVKTYVVATAPAGDCLSLAIDPWTSILFFKRRFVLVRRPSEEALPEAQPSQNPCAEIPVNAMVDWESRSWGLKRGLDAKASALDATQSLLREALTREAALNKEVAALRETKLIDSRYVEELEKFKAQVHGSVERKMNGESGVEAVQRIVAENKDLRRNHEALRTAYETLVNSLKVTPSVFDEHKRMKRQLELAESYNFDRKGLTEVDVVIDFYNYVLTGLGKKPVSRSEWNSLRAQSATTKKMADAIRQEIDDFVLNGLKQTFSKQSFGTPGPWKTPVFDSAVDRFTYFYRMPMPLHYIPIDFIIPDEKPIHRTDTGSTPRCAEGCSHPDCKKANK